MSLSVSPHDLWVDLPLSRIQHSLDVLHVKKTNNLLLETENMPCIRLMWSKVVTILCSVS